MAKLIAMAGDNAGKEFKLTGDTLIGRGKSSTVRVNSKRASRRHAMITRTPRGWMIEDLCSHNGTKVNSRKITKTVLRDAYEIVIGRVPYLFVEKEATGKRRKRKKSSRAGKLIPHPVVRAKRRPRPVVEAVPPVEVDPDAPTIIDEAAAAAPVTPDLEPIPVEPEPVAAEAVEEDDDQHDTDIGEGGVQPGDEPDPLLGATPLHVFSWHGDDHIVELLISNGAEVNARDNVGDTPLHEASRRGHVEVVELLLSEGAKINAANRHGSTPLHEAAGEGCDDVIRILLAHGADGAASNYDGKTPLDFAVRNSRVEAAKALKPRQ